MRNFIASLQSILIVKFVIKNTCGLHRYYLQTNSDSLVVIFIDELFVWSMKGTSEILLIKCKVSLDCLN